MQSNPAIQGYALAFTTIIIWSGWLITSRMGLLSGLSSFDLTFLRFTTAGLLMLPIAIKNLHLITKENRKGITLMMLGAGAPYLLICNMGFASAPASHGILTPSTMPLWVALGAYFLFGEKVGAFRIIGYFFIICGAAFKLSTGEHGVEAADLYFLGGGILWAIYTIQAKRHNYLSPIIATSFVASGTMILFAVPYAIYQFNEPHTLPLLDSAQQIIYQGVLVSVVSLITYNRAMQIIGASQTASFAAFVPVMATLLAAFFLNEIPTSNDWIFVALMTIGVFLASGAGRPIFQKLVISK